MKALKPGRSLGSFVLVRKVAVGGTAEIWAARDGPRPVALKVLWPALAHDASFEGAYRSELDAIRAFGFRGLVGIRALHRADGHLFASMDLVDGLDVRRVLSQLTRRGERLPVPVALHVAREVAAALGPVHRWAVADGRVEQTAHGDVSLHHILLARDGGTTVLDFGVARAVRAAHRRIPDILRGKTGYRAPEQVRGNPATVASDVFGLAVVTWEMLAMRRFFPSGTDGAPGSPAAAAEIRPVLEVNPSVPPAADALIQRMLSSRPQDRPQKMADVKTALDCILEDHYPASAASPPAVAEWVRLLLSPVSARTAGVAPEAPSGPVGLVGPGGPVAERASAGMWAGADTVAGEDTVPRPVGATDPVVPTTATRTAASSGHPAVGGWASQVVTEASAGTLAETVATHAGPRCSTSPVVAGSQEAPQQVGGRRLRSVIPSLLTGVLAVAGVALLYFLVRS